MQSRNECPNRNKWMSSPVGSEQANKDRVVLSDKLKLVKSFHVTRWCGDRCPNVWRHLLYRGDPSLCVGPSLSDKKAVSQQKKTTQKAVSQHVQTYNMLKPSMTLKLSVKETFKTQIDPPAIWHRLRSSERFEPCPECRLTFSLRCANDWQGVTPLLPWASHRPGKHYWLWIPLSGFACGVRPRGLLGAAEAKRCEAVKRARRHTFTRENKKINVHH